MKAYIIARGYPTDKYKMNGIFELDQAIALAKKGVEVVLIALDFRSLRRFRKYKSEYFIKDNVKVYSFHFPIGRYIFKNLYDFSYLVLRHFYKKVEKIEGRPDVIHTYFTDQGYYTSKLAKELNIPFVLTECNSVVNQDTIKPSYRRIAEETYDRTDGLITVSPKFKEKIKEEFGKDSTEIAIIPNLTIFKNNENFKRGDIFNIVSTGNVITTKGPKELIEAFNIAFSNDKHVKLTIYGDGFLRKPLLKMVEELNLTDQVFLPGLTKREKIVEGYNNADMFCLYSYSETFGLAYLEALSAGLPVVASKCGGPEHLINEENGILVDRFNVEKLAEALRYMHDNIEKYDRKKISHDIKKVYSEENITDDVIKVYEEVISKRWGEKWRVLKK